MGKMNPSLLSLQECNFKPSIIQMLREAVSLCMTAIEKGDSFENACFICNEYIKTQCKRALEQIEHGINTNNVATINLAAVQLLVFESMKDTNAFIEDKYHADCCKYVILSCCFLVSNNLDMLLATSNEPNFANKMQIWNTKRAILQKILKEKCTECATAHLDEMEFLYKCAILLGDDCFQNDIKNILCHVYPRNMTENYLQVMHFANERGEGSVYDRNRDPPGQRSVYIPPGDDNLETYRLSTYMRFPQNVPVNPKDLAAAGFFFTGCKDRVKCFSCGIPVENWSMGDDVREPRWHKADCLMMNEGNSGNVPIGRIFSQLPSGFQANHRQPPSRDTQNVGVHNSSTIETNSSSTHNNMHFSDIRNQGRHSRGGMPRRSTSATNHLPNGNKFPQNIQLAEIPSVQHKQLIRSLNLRNESDRLKTFNHWPSENRSVRPTDLARSGFFYLGNLDRVQCYCCGGVLRNWQYGDVVEAEHKRLFPHCKKVLSTDTSNIPLTTPAPAFQGPQEPRVPTETELSELQSMFPCQYPASPHMQTVEARLATFDYRWPFRQVRATPKDIAAAGFFFLGERDRVKCWYCHGGLQDWEPDDEPWREHAKWFPTCEFLLRNKGPEFVYKIVAQYPNLRRPVLRNNPSNVTSFGTNPTLALPKPVFPPLVENHQVESKRMGSDIVQAAVKMGFSESSIVQMLERKLTETGEAYSSLVALVEDLVQFEEETNEDQDGFVDTEVDVSHSNEIPGESLPDENTGIEADGVSETERNRKLQDERRCRICVDRMSDVVFVPCGHLCCCVDCAESLRDCPLCHCHVEKGIRC